MWTGQDSSRGELVAGLIFSIALVACAVVMLASGEDGAGLFMAILLAAWWLIKGAHTVWLLSRSRHD